MNKEFQQVEWDEALESDCRQLVRLAIREDLDRRFDVTTLVLVDRGVAGQASVVTRQDGVVCGLRAAQLALDEMDVPAEWTSLAEDGTMVSSGMPVATVSGAARDLLTAERLILNLIGRLSGIATITRNFVQQISGTRARIYDTRKTTPGWRRLEKYAVRCGGACNHRSGLYDAVLIKDNHLALVARHELHPLSAADAVDRARVRVAEMLPEISSGMIIEVEVDSLAQLEQVLPKGPDIVLLDNMSLAELRQAVAMRETRALSTQLEASGGVSLATVESIAQTGVDRISVGALTHSAVSLDVGLDWE